MRYLVTLGQGEEEVPNRRTVPYRDLVGSDQHAEAKTAAQGFVDLFIEKRLLVADTDPQGQVTVAVAHEALLREWQRVREWLSENREFLRMRDRLDSSLKLWLSRNRQKDDLLGAGLPLAEGEKLVKDFGSSLSREQADYVLASISERRRRKRVQDRIRLSVTAAISLLAIVAGFQWFQAEQQRQSAAQALKAEALVTTKLHEQLSQACWASFSQAERQFQLGEWEEGIALLARGISFDPENQVASNRFFQELLTHREKAMPPLLRSFNHRDVVYHAAFSPDGTRILTASWDKTGKLWDVATSRDLARQLKESVHKLGGRSAPTSMATSPSLQVEAISDVASGLHFSEDGSLRPLPDERRFQLASELKQLATLPGSSGKFIRWFFGTGDDQTTFPANETKISEWVNNALLTNPHVTEHWLQNALNVSPDHSLLHIALAGFEPDSGRADFLRSFGLARLPKNRDFCERAGQMLLDQNRPGLALIAIDRALLIDPTDALAQQLRRKVLDVMSR
jgi:hypothetical protein